MRHYYKCHQYQIYDLILGALLHLCRSFVHYQYSWLKSTWMVIRYLRWSLYSCHRKIRTPHHMHWHANSHLFRMDSSKSLLNRSYYTLTPIYRGDFFLYSEYRTQVNIIYEYPKGCVKNGWCSRLCYAVYADISKLFNSNSSGQKHMRKSERKFKDRQFVVPK